MIIPYQPYFHPAKPYSVPQKERTFAPSMDEDDNIDFVISKSDELTVSLPIEPDTDKLLLTDDGDVQLIEPDNMQVEDRSLVPLSDGTVALPQVHDMEVVGTKNLILKRKNDFSDSNLANIKMIKNDTDIRVRDVAPSSNSDAILPYVDIKHPIQRKMERTLKMPRNRLDLLKVDKLISPPLMMRT